MASSQRRRPLEAPAATPGDQQHELVADVSRCWGYVKHTHDLAQRVGADRRLVAELLAIADQLTALQQFALVAGGWCPECGDRLTDPRLSPSRARHCRRCRLGWSVVEGETRIRAGSRPWPPRVPSATSPKRTTPDTGGPASARSA
jgi:hypothetical protein